MHYTLRNTTTASDTFCNFLYPVFNELGVVARYYGAQAAVLALACCTAVWGLSTRLRGEPAHNALGIELMPTVFVVQPERTEPPGPHRKYPGDRESEIPIGI